LLLLFGLFHHFDVVSAFTTSLAAKVWLLNIHLIEIIVPHDLSLFIAALIIQDELVFKLGEDDL